MGLKGNTHLSLRETRKGPVWAEMLNNSLSAFEVQLGRTLTAEPLAYSGHAKKGRRTCPTGIC